MAGCAWGDYWKGEGGLLWLDCIVSCVTFPGVFELIHTDKALCISVLDLFMLVCHSFWWSRQRWMYYEHSGRKCTRVVAMGWNLCTDIYRLLGLPSASNCWGLGVEGS
jgi:hypothetical protein